MDIESIRQYCLSLPHVTEQIQWGKDLVFKIGGKMFCVMATEPDSSHIMSFRCEDELFDELSTLPGVVPAPYMAKHKWIAILNQPERSWPFKKRELEKLIKTSYELVLAKLPKKTQAALRA